MQCRKVACICALFKANIREWASKSIEERLKGPCYLSRNDHNRKIGPENKEQISVNIPL